MEQPFSSEPPAQPPGQPPPQPPGQPPPQAPGPGAPYPVQYSVDYPDRPLNRLSTFFRLFVAIPILIVIGLVEGGGYGYSGGRAWAVGAAGLVVLPTLLLILFRQKYPRWWFDWNLQLLRFANRVGVYLALMNDRYPSTDEEQSVHLEFAYPDAKMGLNRWLPIVKWFLAIPHYFVLFFLYIGVVFAAIGAWFAILFTGRYPRSVFDYIEGVIRWHNRVVGYAITLVTDEGFVRGMIDTGCRVFAFVEYVPVQGGTEGLVLTGEQRSSLIGCLRTFPERFPALFLGFPGDEEVFGGCLSSGRGFVHVSATGDLEPCPAAPFSDANLTRTPLREALQSRFLGEIRRHHDRLTETGGGCAFWTNREWVLSILSGSGADPEG